MRLDFFLKVSRLIKRRTCAKEYCQKGWIEVNERQGKPGTMVKVGDLITLHLWARRRTVRVLKLPEKIIPKKNMSDLYEIIEDKKENTDADI
ncbi:MAG: RNA-binding S4 domain-containing protein [bacterium]